MPPNDEKLFKIKVACAHCKHVNEIPYSDFRSAMIGNHFFKMSCQKPECGKKTFVTYSIFTLPYQYGEFPETILEKILIPDDTQLKNLKPSDIKLD
jgi:hypothetical protein